MLYENKDFYTDPSSPTTTEYWFARIKRERRAVVESGDNTAGVLAGHAGLPREALDGLAAGGAAAATAGARHVVLSRVGGVQVVARRGRSPPRPAGTRILTCSCHDNPIRFFQ